MEDDFPAIKYKRNGQIVAHDCIFAIEKRKAIRRDIKCTSFNSYAASTV